MTRRPLSFGTDERGQAAMDDFWFYPGGVGVAIGCGLIVLDHIVGLSAPSPPTIQWSPWATAVVSIALVIPPAVSIGYVWGRRTDTGDD